MTFGVLVLLLALFAGVTAVSARSRVRRGRAKQAAAKNCDAKQAVAAVQAAALAPAPPLAIALPQPVVQAPKQPAMQPKTQPNSSCDELCQFGRQSVAIQGRLAWLSGGSVLLGLLEVVALTWLGISLQRTREGVFQQAGSLETQARTLRDQGEILKGSVATAQTSADVAVLQIRHAVASERPWIDVQLPQKDLNYSNLKFVARNRGSSPARVMMYTVEKVFVSTDETHAGPTYGKSGRFDEAHWRLAGDDFVVGEFQLPSDLAAQVQQPSVSVLYQGFIRYGDTLTEDVHETRFCYEAYAQGDGPVRFRMFNAKGYNTMT